MVPKEHVVDKNKVKADLEKLKNDDYIAWIGHALITSLKDKSLRKLIFKNISQVKEEIIFKNEIGRIRDIQVHPNNGKIYFLAGDSLWLMEKN